MSGLVGIYYPDGRPVDCTDLDQMMQCVSHRGPDGVGVWSEGPVGLGHRMLWTTPESLHERLPLINAAGDLVLIADARVDNRDELIDALAFKDRSPSEISDSELILVSYEKWGAYCPEKLLGDFAFVVWDRRRGMLFCARDHFGVKPFYYYWSDRIFVFASEIKALLCLPTVPDRLNEVRVAEYLASMFDDTAITFYTDILRLPPAHSLIVSHDRTQLQRYWSLDSSREVRLDSDKAYAEAFREIFMDAVRCRLRSAFPVGSLLSGGLDSSSVSCVAQRLLAQNGRRLLHTFSAVFDEVPQCDERSFIKTILAQDGFEPHCVHGDQIGPLSDLDRVLWHQDEPFYAPSLFLNWKLYSAAHEQGMRVLLDGHDGDGTVSHGNGKLDELAQARRWLTLAIDARGLTKVYGTSFWRILWTYLRYYELNPLISRSLALNCVRRIWRAPLTRALRWHRSSTDRPAWNALINPDFAQRIGVAERYQAWRKAQPGSARGEREMHYRVLTGGLQPFALEVFDKAAAAFCIELRHPFYDRRLVEFCLALPSEQKLHRGWSRIVLRRGMADVLPAKVQWRVDKSNFLPNFSHGLLAFERERLDELILRGPEAIKEYVDTLALHETYHRFVSGQSRGRPSQVFAMWRAVSLALWLQHIRGTGWKGGELHGTRNQEEGLHDA